MRIVHALVFLAFLIVGGSAASALTFGQTKMLYERKVGEIEADRADAIDELAEDYQGALEKLLDQHTKAAKLDLALAVKAEIELVESGEAGTSPLGDQAAAGVKRERRKFDEARAGLEKRFAQDHESASEKYLALLEELMVTLTKEQKLEAAVEVRDEIGTLRKAQEKDEGAAGEFPAEELATLLADTRWSYEKKSKTEPIKTSFEFTGKASATFPGNYRVRWEALPGRRVKMSRGGWANDALLEFDEDLKTFAGTAGDGNPLAGKRLSPPKSK